LISGTRTSSYGAGFSTVSHEFELLQQRLQQTLHHRQTQEVENMKSELESAEQKALECTGIIKEGKSCIKELENQLQNASKIRKTQLKAAQAELDRCKMAAAASQSKWKEHANDADSLKLELEELRKSIEATDIQLKGNDILFLSLNCMFRNYLCTVYINFLFFI
jgi:chromosome segregation ATPase